MPINLLSLPNEVLLHTANYLPPSSVLALRLTNKHLCAAIEKAFNTICLEGVTFSLTGSGLRSLVRFSRSTLAQHVKVLLLKVDGVYTHLQISSVRNQIYLSHALALLRRRHATLAVGVKYDPKGTVIGEIRNPGAKSAVMGNVKSALTDFLLPAVSASGIRISILYLDIPTDSLHDYDTHAHNPLLNWLRNICTVSSPLTWDILLRYHHSKDSPDLCHHIHFIRGTSLSITGYDFTRKKDLLPFLSSNDFSSLTLLDATIPQNCPDMLIPIYFTLAATLVIQDLTLSGNYNHHHVTLNLEKHNNTNVQCEMDFLSGSSGSEYKHLQGEFTALNGAQVRIGIEKLLGGQHRRWVQVYRKSGRRDKRYPY